MGASLSPQTSDRSSYNPRRESNSVDPEAAHITLGGLTGRASTSPPSIFPSRRFYQSDAR
jgi:hypothetical protein